MPIFTASRPESRMTCSAGNFPVPSLRSPMGRLVVSAIAEEFQKLSVGDLVRINGECGYIHGVGIELIVPPKNLPPSCSGSLQAKRRRSGGYFDAPRPNSGGAK